MNLGNISVIIIRKLCLLPAVPSDMMRLMIQSYADYMQPVSLRVSVGTWNVNGGKHFRSIAFKHEHITDWLLDLPKIIRSIAPGMSVLPAVPPSTLLDNI